jgi:hypothetical protein
MKGYPNVAAFLADLDPTRRALVEVLREMIQRGRPQLEEHIKWNAPSYTLAGVDVVTFNVANKQQLVQLVLHQDTKRPEDRSRSPVLSEDEGLVDWRSDIRGLIAFADRDDALAKDEALQRVLTRWFKLV